MITAQSKSPIHQRIVDLLRPYQPERISLFGSYARGEQRPDSDIDILVHFKHAIGLIRLLQIEQELSEKLGISVDLVTEEAVQNPLLKQYIERDRLPLLP